MKNTLLEENELLYKKKRKIYTLNLRKALFEKISNHILFQKKITHTNQNKQRWVTEAIVEKLNQKKSSNFNEVSPQNRIRIAIDDEISRALEKEVEMAKSILGTFSKKQWILDAIEEKLERESDH